jgi:hypothetical protein
VFFFVCLLRFEVGDGFKIGFWHDLWCGDHSLKGNFFRFVWYCLLEGGVGGESFGNFPVTIFCGIFLLPDQCMIGRWT